jgi:hypothetical protein
MIDLTEWLSNMTVRDDCCGVRATMLIPLTQVPLDVVSEAERA